MDIIDTPIRDLRIIALKPLCDDRGHFSRTFCARDFERHGLKSTIAQANLSFNSRKGTIRGMHFQVPPATETKLVRCTRGCVRDIVVDLRPESATFLQHFSIDLGENDHKCLYVPERFAHGYQTLTDAAEVCYYVGEFYSPEYERGLRFSDPSLRLPWAIAPSLVSDKDRGWPLLDVHRLALIRRELSA